MTKIKRVYLENFKGVKGTHIIELNSESSILMGPNGFGKTTIFDAIELCVTQSIHRTEITKVTKDLKDYSKPFFQNENDKDVCIKVWFENDEGNDLIIVRYYEHDKIWNYTGRRNKPTDFDKLFDLYTQNPEYFEQPIVKEQLKSLNEEDISSYFGLDYKGYNLSDIYKLFAYLQQEETTFFLKQAEDDRKTSLGFLFESSHQENREKQFSSQTVAFTKALNELAKKKNGLGPINTSQETAYEKNFSWREMGILDKKEPFQHSTADSLASEYEQAVKRLVEIQEFITTFSPGEYKKKRLDVYFSQQICTKDFYEFFVLESFLADSRILNKQQELTKILGTKDYPTRIILDLVNLNGEQLAIDSDKYQFISTMLTEANLFVLEITKLERYLQMTGFEENEIQNFKMRLEEKQNLERNLGILDKQIVEMAQARESLHYRHQKSEKIIDEQLCPYCGTDWILQEKLEAAYKELTVHLTKENVQIHESIQKITDEINHNFFVPANNKAEGLRSNMVLLPDDFIEVIQSNQKKNLNEEILSQIKSNLNEESKKYLNQEYQTLYALTDVAENLRKALINYWLYPQELITTLESLKNKDFSQQKENLIRVFNTEDFAEYQLQVSVKPTNEIFNEAVDKLRTYLESLRTRFTYDTSKVFDPKKIYETVFNNSEQNFAMITQEKLRTKMIYLEYQFSKANNQKIQLIKERMDLLEKAIADSKNTQRIYKEQIATYKKNMVQILKVPFFILTGKILQNYQQGMGVFITSSNNGGIRFITDQTSDHDAMHHLSTGQISVISLAFTLACKKCYKVARQIDFIAIDDPIQDMDALNIQSFVDVLRRNYLVDNQIILSTHNDNSAALIKYKLERFGAGKSVEFIDVQSNFF